MTTSGKKFIQRETKNPVSQLTTGTNKSPQPIKITSSEAQTISEATKKQPPKSSAIPTATMTPATQEQKQQIEREYRNMVVEAEEYNKMKTDGRYEEPLLSKAVNIPREIESRFVTAGTQGRQESREKAEEQARTTSNIYKKTLAQQGETQQKRSDAFTVTNPYTSNFAIETNIDFDKLRTNAGSIGDVLPNITLNADRTKAYLTNGTTTVAKPVIKVTDYDGLLNNAYNAVTYEYYTNGNLPSAEEFKNVFPEYKDVSDQEIDRFINECAYDVENGERRDISMYAENFIDLSMPDGYTSKHDSILSLYSDSNYLTYGLSPYVSGINTLEGRTPEEVKEFVQAANTIHAYVDVIKEKGANIDGASDYVIAKQFADDIPELKKAVETYQKFNLKTEEFLQVDFAYNAAMNDMQSFVKNIESLSGIQYDKFMTEYTHNYLQQFNEEFMNSWNKERLQGGITLAGDGWFDNMIYGNSYEVNGKYYDKKGNEIPQDDVHIGVVNRYLETLGSIPYQIDELNFDSKIAAMQPWGSDKRKEMNADILFDSVNLAFASVMSFTQGGVLFQSAMELPLVGSWIESLFDMTLEFLGAQAEIIGNMVGFTDGRSEESKQKYEDAVGGLALMILGGVKGRVKGKLKEKLDNTSIIKATKEFVRVVSDRFFEVDTKPISEVIEKKLSKLEEETLEKGEEPKTEKPETSKSKLTTTRDIINEGISAFNKTFEEEYQKANEGEGATLMDDLFQAARTLFGELTKQRGEEIKEAIKGIQESQGDTVTTEPQTGVETPSGTTTQPTELPEVSAQEGTTQTIETPQQETTQPSEISTPGVKVEETKTGTPAIAEGEADITNTRAEETKNTISKILDVIQNLWDNANEMLRGSKTENVEKETRKAEQERAERDELFKREGLTKKQIEIVESNPFTDTIMRIVNKLVGEITDKKGKVKDVELEDKMSKDEIQREVLSDGLTRMQKYVDRIKQMQKAIGQLYESLSTKKTMRSRDFLKSEPFQRLLKENGLEYIEMENEKGKIERKIVADDDRVLNAKERAVVKYLESMIDIITEKSWISERDAQSIRTNFTSKGDWDSSGDFPKAIKRTLYERRNEFLDQQGTSEVLRKIDKGYADLSENLETLSELLSKDNTIKDNAKNKILKWEDDTLNQMDEILPGFKKLVELTKEAPDIVNKTIKAKTQYKETRKWLGNWIRYGGVMLASKVGGWGGFIIGSLGFTTLERLGNAMKKKAVKTKLDRDLYNQYVNALKVSGNEKAKYKQGELKRIEELNKIAEGKTEAEIQKIMDDATQILIDRQANEIRQRKQAEQEMEQRRIDYENQQKQTERERQQQPVDNALPSPRADVVSPEGEITLKTTNPMTPDQLGAKGVKQQRKPITEVKETYKDKEKTQQGYNQAEDTIIEASLGKTEEKTYSPEAEKVADILQESLNETADIIEQDATNKLIEKGEELTDENIQKEIQKEQPSIEEFIQEMNQGAPEESKNYDGADIKVLEDIVANSKKYPGVDQQAAKDALEKAYRQNTQAEIMQSPDQQQAQKEIAGIYKAGQMELEHNKGREKQREDMTRETNRDFNELETTEEYDRIEKNITPEEGEMALKYSKGYKGFYRSDKAKTDMLLEDMGKRPSQNIVYTNSSDKIATMTNPKSKKRVATERINKIVDKKISEAKTEKTKNKWIDERIALDKIIEEADVQIQAKEEIKAQKRELAEEYKRLEKKREETPFVETKKEITKQIDKIADEFDKLTYEEMKEFVKPESVEAEEIKEAEKIEEEKQILDSNETPQMEDIEEIDEKKEKVESDYEKWDRKQDEMAKDPNITIKSTINEIESIEPGIKGELEERYGEKWDKEESYSDSDIDSITDKLEKSLIERDKKFRKEQREKTKDMESSTITKEQQSQLDKAKTKEEKEKLLDKRRKEYIERNPIAEEYLKEAENHQNERQRRFDLIDKWRAISRRLMNKRHEEENRRREEQRRKIQEQKNAEEKSKRETYDLLGENETPQIDEKPQVVSSEKTPEGEKETKNEQVSKPQSKQLVDVSKDGTVNKEPMVGEYTSKEIQDRIDFLKQKRLDNGKKLYAQDLAELTTLQDLLPRQKERESRPEGTTELSDRQREILNSNNYGDVYTESKSD